MSARRWMLVRLQREEMKSRRKKKLMGKGKDEDEREKEKREKQSFCHLEIKEINDR